MSATKSTKTVCIIGSGVTGLAATSVLDKQGVKVILLEKEKRIGGHCYTSCFTDPNTKKSVNVDMGFMVFSPETYINFFEWLDEYQVESEDTNMSFSASLPDGFSWNSNNPFADPSIFLQWETFQLFWDLCRYEKILSDEMESLEPKKTNQTVADLQAKYNLSDAFMKYFLLPQCASIWTMPTDAIKNIPSDFVVQCTFKHRMSCLWGRPIWKTITGRSQVYVQKILDVHFRKPQKAKRNVYKTQCEVNRLIFNYNGTKQIKIEYANSDKNDDIVADHVLFCCHAKYALQILNNSDIGATRDEENILGSFDFGQNMVILHGNKDIAMHSSSKMWAAWNYHMSHNQTVNVTYWLNLVQNLPADVQNVFATLNPTQQQKEILERDKYHIWYTQHSKYDETSWNIIKSKLLDTIQCVKGRNVSFAGAWTSFGFHRDGFLSGTKEAWRILGEEYKPKSIDIKKGSSYWFSFFCCLIHHVILFIFSFIRSQSHIVRK